MRTVFIQLKVDVQTLQGMEELYDVPLDMLSFTKIIKNDERIYAMDILTNHCSSVNDKFVGEMYTSKTKGRRLRVEKTDRFGLEMELSIYKQQNIIFNLYIKKKRTVWFQCYINYDHPYQQNESLIPKRGKVSNFFAKLMFMELDKILQNYIKNGFSNKNKSLLVLFANYISNSNYKIDTDTNHLKLEIDNYK